jgi:hypothetical protein
MKLFLIMLTAILLEIAHTEVLANPVTVPYSPTSLPSSAPTHTSASAKIQLWGRQTSNNSTQMSPQENQRAFTIAATFIAYVVLCVMVMIGISIARWWSMRAGQTQDTLKPGAIKNKSFE